MTDDHGTQLYNLHQVNRRLTERLDRSARIAEELHRRLRGARAEAAGRKAYAEDLKSALVNQHVELCEVAEKYTAIKQTIDAAYELINAHTPFNRRTPLPNVVNWLVEDRGMWRMWSADDKQELRRIKDERRRAQALLFDAGIYADTIDQGIKELLARQTTPENQRES